MDIKTLAMAALFRGKELIGALVSVFAQKPKILLEDEISLLKGLSAQAASAIENVELFEQVRVGRERQRKLSKSLVDVQEAERRHLAKELHDHLGQVLTGLQFMLESAKQQASGTQRSNLEEIQDSVSDIIRQVREMSLNLRPSMLDDMGLLPTLLWHFDQVSEVLVGLVVQEKTLWVEVLDQGKGFEVSAESEKPSSGLSGMRERVSLLGGYLIVESFINQGTQIVAALPLTDQPLERRKYDRNRSPSR
jgi:signal transduction histidine kinase